MSAMKTIVEVAIIPAAQAHVTPLELLEDFADAAPAWYYLEDESRLYAALKGVPACVLRSVNHRYREEVDLAFAAAEPHEHSHMRLLVVDFIHPTRPFSLQMRHEAIAQFLDAFQRYLRNRTHLVRIQTVEQEVPADAVPHFS